MDMQDAPERNSLATLIASGEVVRLAQAFESSTGLRLQPFDVAGEASPPIREYPRYCRILQEQKVCPLFFDPRFLQRDRETLAVCCAAVGHLIVPINADSRQIGTLVSEPVRFDTNAVDPLARLAFRLKVFPDDLIQAADSVQAVERAKLVAAGERLSLRLALMGRSQPQEPVMLAVKRLQLMLARSDSHTVCDCVAEAALRVSGGDYAGVLVTADSGAPIAWGFQLSPADGVEAKRRLVEGVAEWVKHAGRPISIPELRGSSWSRHLTDGRLETGCLVAVPIPVPDEDGILGAIVVAFDLERNDLGDRLESLERFVEEAAYTILLARRLVY
jgi:ligand-binding sensor protein